MYGLQMATFFLRRTRKMYGPINMNEPASYITDTQLLILHSKFLSLIHI